LLGENMGWDSNRPTIEDKMSDVPSIVQGNFEALQNAMSGEHAGIGDTSSVSGRHCSGGSEWLYEGTTASIALLSSPGSGSLAYDTTIGQLKRYWSSSWNPVSSASWSRGRWYLSSNVSLSSINGGSESQGLSFTGKSYDTLSEWGSAAGTWTVTADGYYLVIGAVTLNNSGTRGTTLASAISATADHTKKFTGAAYLNQTVYPTGDGTHSNWDSTGASYYTEIGEAVMNSATNIHTNANSPAYFSLAPAAAALATADSIDSVVISGYTDPVGSEGIFKLNVNGTWYDSSTIGAAAAYTSREWTVDPSTSAAWTSAGVLSISGIGVDDFRDGFTGTGYLYWLKLLIYADGATNTPLIHTNDGDLTYVELSAGAANCFSPELYKFTQPVTNPTSQVQNISVNLSARMKSSTANAITASSVIRCQSTNYSAADTETRVISSTDWATYTWKYSTNPKSTTAWTAGDIKGTGTNYLSAYGIQVAYASPSTVSADLSYCYAEVAWENIEPYAQLDLIRIPAGGASAVSRSVVQKMGESGVAEEESVRLMDVLPLSAGDKLGFMITKTANNDTVMSGEGVSWFCIHRLGADGL